MTTSRSGRTTRNATPSVAKVPSDGTPDGDKKPAAKKGIEKSTTNVEAYKNGKSTSNMEINDDAASKKPDAHLNTANLSFKVATATPVTPEKKKLPKAFKSLKKPQRSSKSQDSGKTIYYDDIMVETFGEFVVVTVVKKSGKPGFMFPLVKAVYDSTTDRLQNKPNVGLGKNLVDGKKFDARMTKNLYMRQSRACNEKINLNIAGRVLYQLGVICCPDKGYSEFEDRQADIVYEKFVRDEAEKVLMAGTKTMSSKRDIITKFTAWDPSKHSNTRSPNRCLDMIFIDETVGHILMEYFVPSDFDVTQTYDYLDASGQKYYFYSRLDGRYSDYAINTFGYPDDCITKETEESP